MHKAMVYVTVGMEELYMGWKRCLLLSVGVMLFALHTGCGSNGAEAASEKEHTEVTVMYPMELKHFEKLVEDTYPDIDLQAELTTTAAMNGDSERRLGHKHGTDLVVTTMPTGGVKEYMMDLSAEDFASAYQGSVTGPIMIDGQTRYLPLPGQYSGYILNQTLTEELGKTIPESNHELTELFQAAKEQGIGVGEDGTLFGLTTVAASSVGEYIIGTRVPDFLGQAEGIEWMSAFDTGTAGFSGSKWENSLELLQNWTEEEYLNAGTLSLKIKNALPITERMLSGTLLLSHGNVKMLTDLNDKSEAYEYVMLPYLSDEGNEPWVTSAPDGYIGINRELEKEDSRDVLAACIKILDLLSTQEGQDAWMTDTEAMSSYLTSVKNIHGTVPNGITECVRNGYVYNLQMSSNVVQYFGKNMAYVLDQELEMADALAAVDAYHENGSEEVDYDQSVVGSVAQDLLYENYNTRKEETAIGNLIADAVKEYCKTDIAVVNGGGIRASLYKGDVLGEDLSAVCPYENKMVAVRVKGRVIMEMLENGISQTVRDETLPAGRFLQVSGIHYSYRPKNGAHDAELIEVTLEDGTGLDPEKEFTLAVTDYMAGSGGYEDNNGDGYTMLNLYSSALPQAQDVTLEEETGATYVDALRAYFQNHGDEPVKAVLEGRITVTDADD